MHKSLIEAMELLKSNQGLVPEELIKKFEFCSSSSSQYAIKNFVFDGISGPRDYRTALLQVYSKLQALLDLYYGESKRARDIERRQIAIRQLQEKLRSENTGSDAYRLIQLDILDKEEELLQIEDGRKLTKPLVDDALNELKLYLGVIEKLEADGLQNFEESEDAYHRQKTLREAKLELITQRTGLSRGVVDELYRRDPEKMEIFVPADHLALIEGVLTPEKLLAEMTLHPQLEAGENPPAGPTFDDWYEGKLKRVLVISLTNSDSKRREADITKLTAPEGSSLVCFHLDNQGSNELNWFHALKLVKDFEFTWEAACIVEGDLRMQQNALLTLEHALAESDVGFAVPDFVPQKYGAESRFRALHGFDRGMWYFQPAMLPALLDFADPYSERIKLPVQPERCHLPLARVDQDSGSTWQSPV